MLRLQVDIRTIKTKACTSNGTSVGRKGFFIIFDSIDQNILFPDIHTISKQLQKEKVL